MKGVCAVDLVIWAGKGTWLAKLDKSASFDYFLFTLLIINCSVFLTVCSILTNVYLWQIRVTTSKVQFSVQSVQSLGFKQICGLGL